MYGHLFRGSSLQNGSMDAATPAGLLYGGKLEFVPSSETSWPRELWTAPNLTPASLKV